MVRSHRFGLGLLRTASFRLSGIILALSLMSAALLSGLLYRGSTARLGHELRGEVEEEMAELLRLGTESDGLERELRRRLASGELEQFADRLTYGHMPALGTPMVDEVSAPGWQDVLPVGQEPDEPLLGLAVPLDERLLLVAVDAEPLHDARDVLLEELPLGLALMIPRSIPGALVGSAFALRRPGHISRVTERIRRGNLAERVPLRGRGDEYDRLAANINDMLDGIHDLTEGLRQVSNDIAHDLRSPVARLRRHLEVLTAGPRTSEELRAGIEAATTQVDLVPATFGALLRIAQIEAGTRRSGFTPVPLAVLLRDLVEAYEAVAEDAGHQLILVNPAEIDVVGDRALLMQATANLIENAVCHTPAGTRIEVWARLERGEAVIVVADNGPGIPADECRKVFQRFYRLERSRYAGGTGLGLSLVAVVARLHHGSGMIESHEPGVRAILRLPARGATPRTPRRDAARPGPGVVSHTAHWAA